MVSCGVTVLLWLGIVCMVCIIEGQGTESWWGLVWQAERDTIAEREAMEREEEEALERERQRLEARRLQTRDIVSDQISREEAAARAAAEVRSCPRSCTAVHLLIPYH